MKHTTAPTLTFTKPLRVLLAIAQFAAALAGTVATVTQPAPLARLLGEPQRATAAAGDGNFVIDSKVPSVVSVASGTEFNYKINFTCSATLGADTCVNVVVTDTLDSDLAVTPGSVFAEGPSVLLHPTIAPQVDLVNRIVTWTLQPSIEGGTTGELTLRVRAPNGTTPNNTVVNNTAAGTTSRGSITPVSAAPVIVTAADKMNAVKVIGIPTTTLPIDDAVPFRIRLCPSDGGPGGLNATNVSFIENLPAGATYVPGSGSPAPTSVTTSTVTWDASAWPTSTVLYDECRSVRFKLTFPGGVFTDGETYTNTGTVNYTPVGGAPQSQDVAVPFLIGPKVAVPVLSKSGASETAPNSPSQRGYAISLRNEGNTPVQNYVMTDTIPVNYKVEGIQRPSNTFEVDIEPENQVTPTLTFWTQSGTCPTGGDITFLSYPCVISNSVESSAYRVYNDNPFPANNPYSGWTLLNLSGADYITQVQWAWDALPVGYDNGGGRVLSGQYFSPGRDGSTTVTTGNLITNVVTASASNAATVTPTASTLVVGPDPLPQLGKSIVAGSSVGPLGEVKFQIDLSNNDAAMDPITGPVIADLLPAELEFGGYDAWTNNGSQSSSGPYQNSGFGSSAIVSPALIAPTVVITPNYDGTGRTLVRFSWPNTVTVAPQHTFRVAFTTTVKAGTTAGAYHNEAVYFPKPADDSRLCVSTPTVADGNDLDSDGDRAETICVNSGGATAAVYNVISLAVLESRKFVMGELDSVWSGDPIVGRTRQGGDVHYRFVVKNAGNVLVNRMQIVDVLPFVGDVGERTQTPRGSNWQVDWNGPLAITPTISARTPLTDPNITAPITVTAPITIYYSSETKPCTDSDNLPNLFGIAAAPQPAGCAAPNWTTTWSAGARAFKVELDPSVTISGLFQVSFDILTKAPLYAPGATRGVDGVFGNNDDGNVAWNTFGFGAQRSDDNAYLAAQPPRVGIEVESLGLGDFVWFDTDHDGIQDAGEPGIPNVTVNLYDEGGVLRRTTSTDGNGYYQFNGLLDGENYRAVFSPQMGTSLVLSGGLNISLDSTMTWTLPLQNSNTFSDSNVLTQTGTIGYSNLVSVTVAVTETPAGIPYIVQAEHYTPTLDGGIWMPLQIGNRVWYDIDSNGIQDGGEASIPGVVVTLTLANGAQLTATTDALGEYYFTNNPLATPSGNTVFTSAILYGGAFTLTIDPAQSALDDYKLTQQNSGGVTNNSASGDVNDSDAGVVGGMHMIADTFGRSGATNHGYDFGYYTTVALGNRVWLDTDNDGAVDGGEQNVPNVAMSLYRDTNGDGVYSSGDALISSTTTNASGYYTFTDLSPSYSTATRYIVAVDASNFQSGGALAGYRNSTATTVPSTNAADNDRDHGTEIGTLGSASGAVASAPFFLSAAVQPLAEPNEGNEPTIDANSNQTIDFGFYRLVLGNRIWEDYNNNGAVDSGEPDLTGVTVQLENSGGSVISTTTTDANGLYTFTNLLSGTYRVVLPASNFTGAGVLVGLSSSTGANGAPGAYEPGIAEDNTLARENLDHGSVFGTLGQTGVVRSALFDMTPGSEPVIDNATATSTQPTLDFGLFRPAQVGNYVWYDRNRDGVQDNATGEAGVTGISVTLLLNGTPISTTATDVTGHYSFTNLVSGTGYSVRFDLPGTLTLTVGSPTNPDTDATDSDVTGGGQTGTTDAFDLSYGESEPDIDAGVWDPASLGDTIWFDDNGNGQQDGGELGVPGITATLFYSDPLSGSWVEQAVTQTTGGGYYEFARLLPGTYYVSFTLPAGMPYTWTVALNGPTATDSNVDRLTGATAPVTLLAGDNDPTIDGGINVFAALGNFVWDDLNHDGLQDANEPPVQGITVTLRNAGGQVAQMTTDANGYYTFTGLISDTYTVVFDLPAGYGFTRQNGTSTSTGLLSSDSDSNVTNPATGETHPIALAWNTINPNIDAGIWRPLSLGNRVWFDTNDDGQDNDGGAGAPGTGVVGVAMLLYRDTNDDAQLTIGVDELYSSTVTGAGGYYTFTELISDTYFVVAPAANFEDAGVLFGYHNSTPTVAGDSDLNENDHGIEQGVLGASGFVASSAITMTYSGEPVTDGDGDVNTNFSIDFGYNRITLGNLVWEDLNNDGLVSAGEPGVSGVLVTLYDATGTSVLTTTTTDASGLYTFTGLISATYVVGIMPPATYTSSTGLGQSGTPNDDTDDDDNGVVLRLDGEIRSNPVTLTYGGEPAVDDATATSANPTVDFGIWRIASLGNYVWIDNDRDGVQNDPVINGLNGVTVTLLYLAPRGGEWSQVAVTQTANSPDTGESGYYTFTNLISGTYRVEFTLPNGYTWTQQSGPVTDATNSDANRLTGSSGMLALSAGEHNPNVDAGVYLVNMSLGNRVWFDTNNDGVDNDGDLGSLGTGVTGVDVELYADTNLDGLFTPGVDAYLGMTTTNDTGYYTFTQLTVGSYVVVITGTNFTAGGPLAGYRSSTPTSLTPNNDVNEDDNGEETLLAGVPQYVASRAVALTVNGEPVNDNAPASDPFADSDDNSNYSIDFGFFQLVLGNVVWDDVNNNGAFDGDELPLSGVTVTLYDALGSVVDSTTTDVNGVYTFTGMLPGGYVVGVTPPAGYISSTGPQEESDPNGNIDQVDNGVNVQPLGEIRSNPVTLTAAYVGAFENNSVDAAAARTTNPTVDFGIWLPASLGNYVWRDGNRDGVQNDGPAAGLNGVTVTLFYFTDTTWVPYSTTRTANDPLGNPGYYTFTNLISGTYRVGFDLDSLPPAARVTSRDEISGTDASDSDADPETGLTPPVTLVTGEANPTIDMGVIMPAGLGDFVWLDVDHDGVQDAGEPPMAGVTVTLFRDGVPVSTTQTNDLGYYQFVQLEPAVPFSVSFALPAGYTWTLQNTGTISNDSDVAITTGASAVVVLQPEEFNPTLDAGVWRATTLTVSKASLNPGSVRNGQVVGYQIVVNNTGDTLAQGVVVTDPIPAGTTYVSGSASPAATFANGMVTWSGLSVAPGGAVTVTFQVNIAITDVAHVVINNTALMAQPDQPAQLSSNLVANPLDPTAVTMDLFSAKLSDRGVTINWRTTLERETLGFNLWRSNSALRGDAVQINADLIAAQGVNGGMYELIDVNGSAASRYWIEEIELSGARNDYGPALVADLRAPSIAVQRLGGMALPVESQAAANRIAVAPGVAQSVVGGNALVLGASAAPAQNASAPAASDAGQALALPASVGEANPAVSNPPAVGMPNAASVAAESAQPEGVSGTSSAQPAAEPAAHVNAVIGAPRVTDSTVATPANTQALQLVTAAVATVMLFGVAGTGVLIARRRRTRR